MRLVVLGPGASGKTTFAHRLSELTGVPAIELDSVFWSDDLEPLSEKDWVDAQTELTRGPSWILDGDLGPHDVLAVRLARADTVVLFDPPTVRCVWRALRRSRERWDFWKWLLTWRRREKPRLLREIRWHASHARLEVVANDRAAESLLQHWG